ncbi:MAG: Spy/CpxP family protein refolding chaperone [Ramlibacter sp.]
MKPAYKHLLAATALALFGLGAGAQAPQPAVVAPGPATAMQGHYPMMQHRLEHQQQRAAQRQTRLKQILQITPAQEGAWSTWIASRQAGKPFRRGQRAEFDQLTTPERIDRMRTRRAARVAEADRRGEATKAFYAALTPAQQKAFDALQAERGFRRGAGHRGHHRG